MLNSKDFGAVGDGLADDTASLQRALNAAAGSGDTVFLPPGCYRSGPLRIPSHVGLSAAPTWSYRASHGAVLRLIDPQAPALLIVDNAQGVTIEGLCLDGDRLGSSCHGLLLHNDQQGWPRESENTLRLDRCRIDGFTGDGIHLDKAWAFSIRSCMVSHNRGHGIRLAGCDGFFLDNWISGNGGCGFRTESWNGSCTLTANRIEWNHGAGVHVCGGFAYQFTGNYIDRSGGPGILLEPWLPHRPLNEHFSFTGNIIYRSGKHASADTEDRLNAQVSFDAVRGLTFTGNTLMIGQDDKSTGVFTPRFGIVARNLGGASILGNALYRAALEQAILDLGGHDGDVLLPPNPR